MGSLIGAALFTLALLALSLAGVSDPRPIGQRAFSDDFDADHGWQLLTRGDRVTGTVSQGRYWLALPDSGIEAMVASPYAAHPPCTIILIASQASGPTDAGYGLWWGDRGVGPQVIVGLSSDGYLAVLRAGDPTLKPIQPWRVFPHVKGSGQPNKIQIDVEPARTTIRLNDEFVAALDQPAPAALAFGIYGETFSEGQAILSFEKVEVFEAAPG